MKDVPSRYDVRLGMGILGTCKRKTGDLGWLFTIHSSGKVGKGGIEIACRQGQIRAAVLFLAGPRAKLLPYMHVASTRYGMQAERVGVGRTEAARVVSLQWVSATTLRREGYEYHCDINLSPASGQPRSRWLQ